MAARTVAQNVSNGREVMARIVRGEWSPEVPEDIEKYRVRRQSDGAFVSAPHSIENAKAVREGLRYSHPDESYDLMPVVSRHRGRDIVAGMTDNRCDYRNHGDDAVYDVELDGHIVARNLSREDADRFISESCDMFDIFSAIAEFVTSTPEFDFDSMMHVLETMTRNAYYGAVTIRHNPAANQAPVPNPPENDPRARMAHNRVVRNYRPNVRITEVRTFGVTPLSLLNPEDIFIVFDIRTMDTVFIGAAKDGISTVSQLTDIRGNHVCDYRVIPATRMDAYEKSTFWKMSRFGKTLAIGTQEELTSYILSQNLDVAELDIVRY